jgi:hypothetical protein
MRSSPRVRQSLAAVAVLIAFAGCAPRGATTAQRNAHVADRAGTACSVSFDGTIWYRVAPGPFAPIEYRDARCRGDGTLSVDASPAIPAWARPDGPTHALFAATSFEEDYTMRGMRAIAKLAHAERVPVTWMVDDPRYLQFNRPYYERLHSAFGDDLEIANNLTVYYYTLPLKWFARAVSIDGAGRERPIANDRKIGARGFWGITWNSLETDATSDRGAPWGAYCADPGSYKRPQPRGCDFVGFEWTARDLTRAYLDDDPTRGYSAEAAFSTDPDDLIDRGGFTHVSAATYVQHVVDAYAAAGETQPLLVLSQQEPVDEDRNDVRDAPVMRALYARAAHDGMRAITLRTALALAPRFAARPRAIAFPFIAGGRPHAFDGTSIEPATIDYHDARVGLTFLAGHTLPSRVFSYDEATHSRFDRALPERDDDAVDFPKLIGAAVRGGSLAITIATTRAMRFGVAIWSDPRELGVTEPSVTVAGRAGFVATFDLPTGTSTHLIACPRCTSTTFAYSR